MADLEERPTKIRKLDIPNESNESPQSNTAAPEAPETAFSEATSDQLEDEGGAPFQDGQEERDDAPNG